MSRSTVALMLLLFGSALMAGAQEQPQTVLRHDSFVAFRADAGETVRIAVQSIQRGTTYGTPMTVSIINPRSDVVLRRTVALNSSEVISYPVELGGLHVARIQTGWNTGTVEVLDRPWALVAWQRVPVNICGHMRPQYFFVPDYLEKVRLALSASVTGEGALVQVRDPEGQVVFAEEGDFDNERQIEIAAAATARGKVWSLTVERPAAPQLVLDDVQLYLGAGLPPYLAERPQWLTDFVSGEQYQPDLIERTIAVPGGGAIPQGQSITLSWPMDELPEDRVYALRLTANDVDYVNEVAAVLNGGEPFYVPMTGNAVTETFTLRLDRSQLVRGQNTLTLTQNPAGGSSTVVVKDVQVLIGTRIREFTGW